MKKQQPVPIENEDKPGAFGAARPLPIVKAGCGIRYDPEQLESSEGVDFSAAVALKTVVLKTQEDEDAKTP